MKKIFTLCFLLFLLGRLHAQAPNAFSFQGVAKNAAGQVIVNGASIQVRFTIKENNPNGASVYQETHITRVKASGIFNVAIGKGTVVSGTFNTIAWPSNEYFVQVEVDPTGGSNFVDMGTSQLLSTPYALHSATSNSWKQNAPIIQKGDINLNESLGQVGSGARLVWFPARAAFRDGVTPSGTWENDFLGAGSFAVGAGTTASGQYSAAFGSGSKATGQRSVAMGDDTEASGEGSIAGGNKTKAVGNYSLALGSETTANSAGAVAMGTLTQAEGAYSVALGKNSKATSSYSFAAGESSSAAGISSVALGSSTQANGQASVAFGDGTIAKSYGGFVVGAFNNQQDAAGGLKASAAPTQRIFQIGNGSSAQATSNAITVLRNGNVGIGNNALNPVHILEVGGRARIRHNSATAGIYFDNSENVPTGFVGMQNDLAVGIYNGKWILSVFNNSQVYVDGPLSASGNITTDGTIHEGSDRRWKKNIVDLTSSFEKIQKVNGYNYHWIDEKKGKEMQTGVIAQEVEEIFPELVKTDDKGFKSVNYSGFIPHLIEAVKELKKENDALKAENGSLNKETQAKLAALEARLDALSQNQKSVESK